MQIWRDNTCCIDLLAGVLDCPPYASSCTTLFSILDRDPLWDVSINSIKATTNSIIIIINSTTNQFISRKSQGSLSGYGLGHLATIPANNIRRYRFLSPFLLSVLQAHNKRCPCSKGISWTLILKLTQDYRHQALCCALICSSPTQCQSLYKTL
jgi:hypothetical protein